MKRLLTLVLCTFLLSCAAIPQPESQAKLTFVHLNDTYRVGAVEDGNAGGFSRVTTTIRDLQAAGRDVRVLHGGDFLYPSLESGLWNGLQMVDAFNFMDALAPMYVVAGNHEFDRRTPEHLVNAVRASKFDWLGDNYTFNTGDAGVDAALQSSFTFDSGGKTIGIFSLTLHADDGGNTRDYVPVEKDYMRIAQRQIEALETMGVDAIIGVTHLHMWQDTQIAQLRAEHPKFVFIVGGHEHEPEYRALDAGNAAVMKGASNARIIWSIELEFDAAGMPVISPQQIELDQTVQLDSGYQVLEDKWRSRLLEKFPFLEATVGIAAVTLDGREVTVRNEESNWGNFIADQMRGAFDGENADFAFINGGTLRIDDFIAGDIQFEDIGRTFGFSSYLRRVSLTGADFQRLLEAGYRGFGPSKGYFPQISGFRACVDRSRNEYDRIVSLQVPAGDGWQEIDASTEYSFVMPDYLYSGGDGYEVPQGSPATPSGSELKYRVLDAILVAQAQGLKVGAAVDPENPRYFELKESKQACFE